MAQNDLSRRSKRTLENVADDLRKIVLDHKNGAFIGSEEMVISKVACSRSTLRQAARLIEREGLLLVKRGINGGYFGARPSIGTIEATVSNFLETLEMDKQDITIMASSLWVEAVCKAALRFNPDFLESMQQIRKQVKAIKADASFEQVRDLELLSQTEIFRWGNSGYIKLIFDINIAFAERKFTRATADVNAEGHAAFVRTWRDARLMEFNAIEARDRDLAQMASHYSRSVWFNRLARRYNLGKSPSW